MKVKEREKAKILRTRGMSMRDISNTLGVSKASVSLWVRDIELTSKQKNFLNSRNISVETIEKRRKTRLENENQKREAIIQEASKEITKISKEELKLIGSMLYWAEGRKRGKRIASFSNSDPEIIKVMMLFFRNVCMVENEKFRGHIHTHSHLNVKKAEKYWSELTNIPLKQFYKTYTKPTVSTKQKMDKLPFGTLDVSVCDVKVFLKIMGWINKINVLVVKNKC